ncbi:hypothetical protein LUZ61_014311 [Rhynchospora tenuis]|uniref:Reverse transcriptase domain-containing protein n=1 Tax=Rhynchospora tenuis TaxID=198213 RepID=A0AAD5Z2H5_9POAL|nr:hypothetical protein LUZ61_014311 [Rhynchospora tenuis]
MSIFAWNCCGSGGRATIPNLARYLHATRSKIAFISETRADLRKSEQRLRNLPLKNNVVIPCVGKSGGIWLLWSDDIKVRVVEQSFYFFFAVVQEDALSQPWTLGAIYGDPHDRVTEYIWERVEYCANHVTRPLCIIGDLNAVAGLHEKFGGSSKDKRKHRRFRAMANRTQLIDLGYHGCAYTWTNNRPCTTLIMQRLDRAMASVTWTALYPSAKVYHLPRSNSDHVPILLCLKPERVKGRRTFKVENWWMNTEGFDEACQRALNTGVDHGQMENWDGMLNNLRKEIRRWEEKVHQPMHELAMIESMISDHQSSAPDPQWHEKHQELQVQYNRCLLSVEAYWAQRSRIRWAVLGDRNTSFFHATVASRRRRNSITSLLGPNSQVITDPALIRKAFVEHYKGIFSTNNSAASHVFDTEFIAGLPEVSYVERQMLAAQPSDEEITKIVFAIHPDRASGPDGLNGKIVQHYWALFKPYIIQTVRLFFETGQLDPALARSNVVLIPKIDDPKEVTDYRPVSVCNFIYKVISKLLSARMRVIMSKLVGSNQCAFVPGRIISDNILLLREIMHSFASSAFPKQAFCFKCDLSKAFDRMEWHFVVRVLQLYGFPPAFISWVMGCVTSASFAILFNGSTDGFITPTRGLRQGCALSPYLFILCMDILNRMFEFKMSKGLLSGLSISRGAPAISSILYADDLLICGMANTREVQEVKNILQVFCELSGQSIGVDKSRIWFSKRTGPDIRAYCMNIFQACEGENSHTYLGVPILATQAKHFDYLVDKVMAKLHPWKARMLSQAAKVVLIKSVIEPLLLYSMGAGWIPQSILQKINAKIRAFFWNTGETNKMRMVAWETITKPKRCGGLGLRDTRVLNQAAVLRVLWKIASNEFGETLWVRVLSAKYLSRAPLWLATVPSRCSKLWLAVLAARDIMKPHVQWLLGDGRKCSLVGEPWHDFWDSFVHQIGPSRGRLVSDFVDATNGGWDVPKLLQALGFSAALYIACTFQQPPLKPNVRDRLIFKPASSGNFSFKTACNLLEGSVVGGTIADAIWRRVWHCRGILPKVQMFFWKLLHDAIPVKATFAKRMRTQPPPCDVCGLGVDDAMHVLFLCNSSRQCWLASDLGLRVGAMPQQIVPALTMVIQQLEDESLVRFANILWAVWKARCKEVYEGKRSNVRQILGNASNLNELSRLIKHSTNPRGISITVSIPRVQELPMLGMHCVMDGSFQEDGRAGWAYRIYKDGVLVKFEIGAEEATSSLHAEVLAFKAALYAVLKEGLMEACFYTDCETLVKVLNGVLNPELIDWRVYLLVVNIISAMQQHVGLVCCHAPRELLIHEHDLANYARRLDLCAVGFTFPSFPGIATVG